MAKPRIFVSSTYYDLKHIRDRLEAFIESFGYEPVLFESGDVPFRHDAPLDESCYAEVQLCHILILLIGGRYGSPTSADRKLTDLNARLEFYNSVTRKEYETAREREIPIFVFVEKNVLAEYETYRHNKERADIAYAHVDSVNIFLLLDDILSRQRNNFMRGFERFDDISHWLREQWAGLFADLITRRSTETGLKDLAVRVAELGQVSGALKEYSEVLIKNLKLEGSEEIIQEQDRKLLAGRIRAFRREPMIRYLLDESTASEFFDHVHKPTPERLYQAFAISQSLEDFLRAIGYTEKAVANFLEMHDRIARRDFDTIGERFFGRESSLRGNHSAEPADLASQATSPAKTQPRKRKPRAG